MTSRKTTIYYAAAAAAGLLLGLATRPAGAAEPMRTDLMVRNDLFAGFAGNAEALDRAMSTCEKLLGENPNNAGALVWHGAGVYFRAGQHFMKSEPDKGMPLAARGIEEMDRAVALAPDDVGVRIPRGSVLAAAARTMPDSPYRRQLFERVLADYLHIYEMQKDGLGTLGVHPRGELLFTIADAYSRTGQPEKAAEFFGKLAAVNPDTLYAKRAHKWSQSRQPLPLNETGCIGCHGGQ
jgi:tetratricopeptide (TPR) repeat protein